MTEVQTTIKAFLMKSFRNYDFQIEEDIFSLGFVNSMFVIQLVSFLENTFGMTVENEDLELDNFRSINALSNLVQAKQPV